MAYNTIKVKKYSDVIEEMTAGGTITPGMLVEMTSTGTCRAHSAKDENAIPMFALEDEMQGKTVDDNYVATDQVQVWIPGRGDMVYALLAQGQNVTKGALLSSNGDGRLKAAPSLVSTGDVFPLQIVAQAMESVNASSAAKRILIRIA